MCKELVMCDGIFSLFNADADVSCSFLLDASNQLWALLTGKQMKSVVTSIDNGCTTGVV